MSRKVVSRLDEVRTEQLEDGRMIAYYKFGDEANAVVEADSESIHRGDCGECVSPDESSVSSD